MKPEQQAALTYLEEALDQFIALEEQQKEQKIKALQELLELVRSLQK